MIRPLRRAEASGAARLAARAFSSDPLFAYLYPDEASRQRRFATEHAAYIRRIYLPLGQPFAAVDETSGALRGIALWLPPEAMGALDGAERACLPALRRAAGLQDLARVLRAYDAFDAAFPEDMWFYYLGLLAVTPEAQSQGVGSALLREGTDRADREGVACYLETGTKTNVAFYERHGFRVTHEIPLPDGGPTHWGLWRDPAPGGA